MLLPLISGWGSAVTRDGRPPSTGRTGRCGTVAVLGGAMDWLTPMRRAALERLGAICRPEGLMKPPPAPVLLDDHRGAWPFRFSEDGRRAALGPTISSLFKPDWLTER